MVALLGAGPGLYFDLATLSFHAPSAGSAAQRFAPKVSIARIVAILMNPPSFYICAPPSGRTGPSGPGINSPGSTFCASGLSPRLAEHWHDTELLHHAEGVPVYPLLCHFSAGDAEDAGACRRDFLTGRLDVAQESSFVRTVSSPADGYLMAFAQD